MSNACPQCQSPTKKFGKTKDGRQRYRCLSCRKVSVEALERLLPGTRVPDERAVMVLQLLCEGMSVRAIERLTGTEKSTILRLLVQAGEACERLMAERIKDVPVKDVECDEIWSYVRCKEGTKKRKGIDDMEAGDCYCFTALERESKLLLAFQLGRRNTYEAHDFMAKLSTATAGNFQISTDAWAGYPETIEYHLGARVDYGMVTKEFVQPAGEELRRYAPPRLLRAEKAAVYGSPDPKRMGTSRIERSNWTIRTHLRRMTRLSNGFSRKRANLRANLALFFMYYNYVKIHTGIRMTPAMKAGIARKPWTMADLLREAGAHHQVAA
jgi:transposase-like protein/IS1 family transposase